MSVICVLDGKGTFSKVAEYSCEPKKALVAYLMQSKGNYNTYEYPDIIPGMRESVKAGCWVADLEDGGAVAAYGDGGYNAVPKESPCPCNRAGNIA